MKENQKGITLIALVVTIVVLLILAGVSVNILLGNGGLIQRAETAKSKMNEAQKSEKQELDNIESLINKNVDNSSSETEEYEGISITTQTQGIVFTKSDGSTEGDVNNIETGDIIKYGDYEYHFNQKFYTNPFGTGWSDEEAMDGWGVKAIDRSKSEYGELCGTIYGKKVKNIDFLFGSGSGTSGNKNIEESPKIPSGIESMGSTFQYCTSLKKIDKIPSSVKSISYAFMGCESLEGTIVIDANPENYYNWISGNKEVTITGSSKILNELAEGKTNVSVK